MSLSLTLSLLVCFCSHPTQGLDDVDKKLNFFKISRSRTGYGGVTFRDIQNFYLTLCNETTLSYAFTLVNFNKLDTSVGTFPPDHDPDLYLTSYQCERNAAHYFICQRMLKMYVPEREQRWYMLRLDNTSCSTDGIKILSGVDQVFKNKHFTDITVDPGLECERQASESKTTKDSHSTLRHASVFPHSVTSSSQPITSSAPEFVFNPAFQTVTARIMASKISENPLLTPASRLPTKSLIKIPTRPTSGPQSNSIPIMTPPLSVGAARSQSPMMEGADTGRGQDKPHVPVYILAVIGTLSTSTVVLSVLTCCLIFKQRNSTGPRTFSQSKNVKQRSIDGVMYSNEYTDLHVYDTLSGTENTI
ncbi:unnamed protein product [Lymnaea stagnalis]|uniref:Uncharacterized protein n=1 Tax=Lymnaea stagnalis TaxID=6523 RepID=A0AAV2H591_LYMST